MPELIKFYGRKNSKKNAIKFVEDINEHFHKENYLSTDKYEQAIQVKFWTHLADKALDQYKDLLAEVKKNWNILKIMFLAKYKLIPQEDKNLNQYFNLMYNLKQKDQNIITYVNKVEQLHKACLATLILFFFINL